MTREPIVILVSIPLKPGRAKEYLLDEVTAAMRNEETYVNAVALQSSDDPDTIMLYQTWLDRDNFSSVQRKRAYRDTYEARLPELLREPRQVTFYSVVRSDSRTGRAPIS